MRNVNLRGAIKWAYNVTGPPITGPSLFDVWR